MVANDMNRTDRLPDLLRQVNMAVSASRPHSLAACVIC